MEKDVIYIVVGNKSGGVAHFCEQGEIVIGTGNPGDSHLSYRYERETYEKHGFGLQYIHILDVFKIGKL